MFVCRLVTRYRCFEVAVLMKTTRRADGEIGLNEAAFVGSVDDDGITTVRVGRFGAVGAINLCAICGFKNSRQNSLSRNRYSHEIESPPPRSKTPDGYTSADEKTRFRITGLEYKNVNKIKYGAPCYIL